MQSIGDMAQTLVLRHNQTQLRSQVGRLGVELSTGVASDRAAHLGGDLTALATLDRSLKALEGFRVATAEATYIADVMQNALGQLQSRVEDLGPRLMQTDLLVSEFEPGDHGHGVEECAGCRGRQSECDRGRQVRLWRRRDRSARHGRNGHDNRRAAQRNSGRNPPSRDRDQTGRMVRRARRRIRDHCLHRFHDKRCRNPPERHQFGAAGCAGRRSGLSRHAQGAFPGGAQHRSGDGFFAGSSGGHAAFGGNEVAEYPVAPDRPQGGCRRSAGAYRRDVDTECVRKDVDRTCAPEADRESTSTTRRSGFRMRSCNSRRSIP